MSETERHAGTGGERPEDPVVATGGLVHVYPDGTRALDGVDFAVAAGERLALVGPNGSGKTTLLHHLNGLLFATEGTVRVSNREVTARAATHARAAVGLLFQDPDDQLFMPTVVEDVAFGPLNAGAAPGEAEARARQVLEDLGLGAKADKAPHTLSGGQKRLAALAGLLVMDPVLLALDEPTAGLDPRAKRHLERTLEALSPALLMASHDLEFCLRLCPEAVVLDGGRVVRRGPSRSLFSDCAFMESHGLEKPHSLQHLDGDHCHPDDPGGEDRPAP